MSTTVRSTLTPKTGDAETLVLIDRMINDPALPRLAQVFGQTSAAGFVARLRALRDELANGLGIKLQLS